MVGDRGHVVEIRKEDMLACRICVKWHDCLPAALRVPMSMACRRLSDLIAYSGQRLSPASIGSLRIHGLRCLMARLCTWDETMLMY